MTQSLSAFLHQVQESINQNQFVKLAIGAPRNKTSELKSIAVKNILLKEKPFLSFVYRYTTKDITKNFSPTEALDELNILLVNSFFNADLYTISHNYFLLINKNETAKLVKKVSQQPDVATTQTHNKTKNRLIQSNNIYLQQLGISTATGQVKQEMFHKYKQINKFIEIIDGILKNYAGTICNIIDMGSGKGYLTFALYDYLQNIVKQNINITGVEMRPNLVQLCNELATKCNFNHLQFIEGTIQNAPVDNIDMLIALHACNTATDDAIAKGIKANASIIICAPCCHQQIRQDMSPTPSISPITKHGILLERQAEILTDTIRALLLENHGYSTKVFDFISTEHTPKNVLIVGVKNKNASDKNNICLEKIQTLKTMFGINQHYLENLL